MTSLRRHLANPVLTLGLAIALVGGTGVATAATGGTFLLGRANTASTTTGLRNDYGTALSLTSKAGTPPLAVSNTTKVPRLNADLLDGLSSGNLQRRVSGSCATGAIAAVGSAGNVRCVPTPRKIVYGPVVQASDAMREVTHATFDGVRLVTLCDITPATADTAASYFFAVALDGSAGVYNGFVDTAGAGTAAGVTNPVGGAVNGLQSGNASTLWYAVSPADDSYERWGGTVMVEVDGHLTQIEFHALFDRRTFNGQQRPCLLWATVT